MYIATCRKLPLSAGFSLGRWEVPIVVVAVIWLVYLGDSIDAELDDLDGVPR